MAKTTKTAKLNAAMEDKRKEARFTTEQLLLSPAFAKRRDVVNAVLATGKTYTVAEANAAIKNFYERRVK